MFAFAVFAQPCFVYSVKLAAFDQLSQIAQVFDKKFDGEGEKGDVVLPLVTK